MKRLQTLRTSRAAAALLYGLLFLAFFQLLTDFLAAVYAFGLMGVDIPPEIGFVLFLLAPLVLMLRKKPLGGRPLAWIAAVALACRAVEPLLPTRARLLVAGIGTACMLVVFAGWLSNRDGSAPDARSFEHGLALATGFAMLLRAAGNGLDLSMVGMFKGIGWLCALIAGGLLFLQPATPTPHPTRDEPPPFGRIAGLCAGMVAAFALLYFAFTAPNVIARWAGIGFMPVILLSTVALVAYGGISDQIDRLPSWVMIGWNLAFAAALTGAVGTQRVVFPSELQPYPLEAPLDVLQIFVVGPALLLFPVIFVDFHLFYREIRRLSPSQRAAGGGLGLAGLFLLVLIFMNVFTTVYDYIPVVGPLMRDRYWLVFLVAGVGLTAPLALVDWSQRSMTVGEARSSWVPPIISGVFGVCGVLGMMLATIPDFIPYTVPGPEPTLRVLTYNIQQGYDARGQKAYTEQLQVLRQSDADVIGLQETDTNRIAGGNDDLVRYLAGQLSMYSYYGPRPVAGTFGIALLSKFQIEHPRTFFMYSTGEQTAGISAQIYKGGTIYNVIVTHLGNDGPPIQQTAVLREAELKQNVILMGDFNFDASSPAYRATVATLADAWWLRWPQGIDTGGFDAAREIDHVFVSPGMKVSDVQYLTGPQSDHPALLVQIGG